MSSSPAATSIFWDVLSHPTIDQDGRTAMNETTRFVTDLGLQLWTSGWSDNTIPGRVIVAAILLIAVLSWRAFRVHRARYRREERNLSRTIQGLMDWRREEADVGDLDAQEDGPVATEDGEDVEDSNAAVVKEVVYEAPAERALIDLGRLKEGLAAQSLVWQRLSAIETLRAHRVRVNVDTVQQLAVARDGAEKALAFPAFAAGASMLLGILGTFFGLAIMVQQIQLGLPESEAVVSFESWNASIENLRTILGGMGTAFSTSLIGMTSALVSTTQDYRLRAMRSRFFERFERFTTEELLPASVPAVDDESLLERVTFQLEQSFDRLESIHGHNRRTLEELTGAQEAFVTIVDEIRAITRSEAARDLDRVVEQLAETNRSVLKVVEQLPGVGAAVQRGARELVGRIESSLSVSSPGRTESSGLRLGLIGVVAAALLVFWLLVRLT